MRTLFADTVYFVAVIHRGVRWHSRALALSRSLRDTRLVTTQEVLSEVLTYFASFGPVMRALAVQSIRQLESDANTEVLPQTPASFEAGLALYAARLDKEYSLIDCTSMAVMRARGIIEVLTHDHHFVQEGFVAPLRDH